MLDLARPSSALAAPLLHVETRRTRALSGASLVLATTFVYPSAVYKIAFTARIYDRASREPVDVRVRPADIGDVDRWLTQWGPHRTQEDPDFKFWWDNAIGDALAYPDTDEVYVVDNAGELEGMRWIVHEGHPERGSLGIWNRQLAAAPWNRGPCKRHVGAGRLLVGVSVMVSQVAGLGGRIFCEPLPGAVTFHQANGMDPVPNDPRGRYSLSMEAADDFLVQLRIKGFLP